MKNLRLMCLLTISLIQASLYGAWNQPPDLVSNPAVSVAGGSGPVLREILLEMQSPFGRHQINLPHYSKPQS